MIGGKLDVKDLNARWNDDMKKLLDVAVETDDKGVLQDVHWSALAFGYFPTYLIGAICAAQLFEYCSRDIPDVYHTWSTNGDGSFKKANYYQEVDDGTDDNEVVNAQIRAQHY